MPLSRTPGATGICIAILTVIGMEGGTAADYAMTAGAGFGR